MCHVLIIEDEPLIADYVAALVTEAGASSLAFASTEQEAIEEAVSAKPSVILSDIRLSEGTGPGAIRSIIARLGSIPVIFVTGSPDEIEKSRCDAVILTKPFRPFELKHAFRDAVARSAASPRRVGDTDGSASLRAARSGIA